MKLPITTRFLPKFILLLVVVCIIGLSFTTALAYIDRITNRSLGEIKSQKDKLSESQASLNYLQRISDDSLYEAQIKDQQIQSLTEQKSQVETELEQLETIETNQLYLKITDILEEYDLLINKVRRNQNVGLETNTITSLTAAWGTSFLQGNYDETISGLTTAISQLDQTYSTYLASLPTPTPKPTAAPTTPGIPTTGYSYQTVPTNRGNFNVYLIKLPLSQYTVKTITANSSECSNGCPAKSLAEYVSENNAYAGMNGTYFCPPDYTSCTNSTYSTDFAVYNSNLGTWFKQNSITWNNLGMAAFNGSIPLFFTESKSYANQPVTAAMVNFPSLLHGGNYVVNESSLSSYQKDTKGVRGIIGTDGTNIYLAHIVNATVIDAAYVAQTLGIQDALNLDGGGSSALYINGAYKVGPGRLLPNVVLLIPK